MRRTARWYACLVLGGAVLAVVAMERALITRDFTVAATSPRTARRRTPALYNFATLWSPLEGSILLWGLVLVRLPRRRRRASSASRLDDPLVGWALLTIFVVAAFFFALMLGPANPFQQLRPPAGFDGPARTRCCRTTC